MVLQKFNIIFTNFTMIYQFNMSIWYHIFRQFLFIPFCLIVSAVHGGRDVAHYDVGAIVSFSGFDKGLEKSHELTGLKKTFPVPSRSLNSMQQNEYTKDASGENFYLPLTEHEGNFGVTVGLGTPKRDFTLLFDTGSDMTWIRCQACVSDCNDKQPAVFNTSQSQTFSEVPCNGNDGSGFSVTYNDRSSSAGYCISDTLSFMPNDHSRFVFGCAQNVSGNFSGTSGVLGIGGGKNSLMAVSSFHGLFCYCLPASDQGSTGFLVLGSLAHQYCPVGDTSGMLDLTVNPNQDGSTQYFVKLIGITIGRKTLDTSSIMGSSPNVMIDSGTIITRLPPPVYAALKSEFNKVMSGFPVVKTDDIFDACYSLDGGVQNWTSPEMVMHFEHSVDVKLDPSAVTVKNDSQVCLAFVENSDESKSYIIGNQQLREHSILLDLEEQKLGFSAARTGCTR